MPRAAVTLCVFLLCAVFPALPACSHARGSDALTLYAEETGGTIVDGKWVVEHKKSAMGVKDAVTVVLFIEGGLENGSNSHFMMANANNRRMATFYFDETFMGEGPTRCEYILDGQPAIWEEWQASEEVVIIRDAIPFLRTLAGHKKLVVRGYPAKGGRVELAFNIRGIENVLPFIEKEWRTYDQEKADLARVVEAAGGSVVDGKWLLARKKSAMGDRTNIHVSLFREEDVKKDAAPQFSMGCIDSEILVGFDFAESPMQEGLTFFEYKIDDQPIQRDEWRVSDGTVLPLDPISFMNSLAGRKKLVVRGYPLRGASVEMSFNIEGIENVLPLIQNECQVKDIATLAAERLGGSVVEGKWIMLQKKSALDDRTDITVSLPSEESVKKADGTQFILLYAHNKLMACFYFGENPLVDGTTFFAYKIDNQPPTVGEGWSSGAYMFVLDVEPFLKSLTGRKKLIVEGRPAKGPAMELSFNIEGIEKVLPLIQNECGWR